jgi:hypothetical protein
VVLGMLAFGLCMTGVLFLYWELHTARFREVQEALAARFPGSKPRVEGGRPKSTGEPAETFRVVLQVSFDPEAEPARAERFVDDVLKVAADHEDLRAFETLHVHLYAPDPERRLRQQSFYRAVAEKP